MILIVDSENTAEINTRRVFESSGFRVIEIAKTAQQARDIIAESEKQGLDKISLIIICSQLEDADGFEFCREISKTETGHQAFILMLISSMENKLAIEKSKHCGATDYGVKPYSSLIQCKAFARYMLTKGVIIVEDDALIRQMVVAILARFNMEVIEVDDGQDAHNLINSITPVRLVLLDIVLPNINGIQLLALIRQKPIWSRIPVVMLTSSTDAVHVRKALSGGAKDYIVKPFRADDFVSRLQTYLPQESVNGG